MLRVDCGQDRLSPSTRWVGPRLVPVGPQRPGRKGRGARWPVTPGGFLRRAPRFGRPRRRDYPLIPLNRPGFPPLIGLLVPLVSSVGFSSVSRRHWEPRSSPITSPCPPLPAWPELLHPGHQRAFRRTPPPARPRVHSPQARCLQSRTRNTRMASNTRHGH